jgi:hypothetical protein
MEHGRIDPDGTFSAFDFCSVGLVGDRVARFEMAMDDNVRMVGFALVRVEGAMADANSQKGRRRTAADPRKISRSTAPLWLPQQARGQTP